MDIGIEKVLKITLGKINEYSDGRFYRELEIVTENDRITITLAGEEDGINIKL